MKPLLKVADYDGYAHPFLQTFDLTDDIHKADALMLTGGADVSPALYGEPVGRQTYTAPHREKYELEYSRIAIKRGIPIIGICRGAQLLCVLNGGKLVQDVTNHTSSHPIFTIHDGTEKGRKGIDADIPFIMTSLHHQMMRPEGTDHVLIAWTPRRSKHYLNGQNKEIYERGLDKEPEIVVFNKVKGLAIQGHPEMLPVNHPTVHYCNELVRDYLLGKKEKQ